MFSRRGVSRVMTTTRNQNRVAAAARKVGGYDVLVRLSREWLSAPVGGVLVRDAKTGEWSYRKPQNTGQGGKPVSRP
jgi:hypothetical protein